MFILSKQWFMRCRSRLLVIGTAIALTASILVAAPEVNPADAAEISSSGRSTGISATGLRLNSSFQNNDGVSARQLVEPKELSSGDAIGKVTFLGTNDLNSIDVQSTSALRTDITIRYFTNGEAPVGTTVVERLDSFESKRFFAPANADQAEVLSNGYVVGTAKRGGSLTPGESFFKNGNGQLVPLQTESDSDGAPLGHTIFVPTANVTNTTIEVESQTSGMSGQTMSCYSVANGSLLATSSGRSMTVPVAPADGGQGVICDTSNRDRRPISATVSVPNIGTYNAFAVGTNLDFDVDSAFEAHQTADDQVRGLRARLGLHLTSIGAGITQTQRESFVNNFEQIHQGQYQAFYETRDALLLALRRSTTDQLAAGRSNSDNARESLAMLLRGSDAEFVAPALRFHLSLGHFEDPGDDWMEERAGEYLASAFILYDNPASTDNDQVDRTNHAKRILNEAKRLYGGTALVASDQDEFMVAIDAALNAYDTSSDSWDNSTLFAVGLTTSTFDYLNNIEIDNLPRAKGIAQIATALAFVGASTRLILNPLDGLPDIDTVGKVLAGFGLAVDTAGKVVGFVMTVEEWLTSISSVSVSGGGTPIWQTGRSKLLWRLAVQAGKYGVKFSVVAASLNLLAQGWAVGGWIGAGTANIDDYADLIGSIAIVLSIFIAPIFPLVGLIAFVFGFILNLGDGNSVRLQNELKAEFEAGLAAMGIASTSAAACALRSTDYLNRYAPRDQDRGLAIRNVAGLHRDWTDGTPVGLSIAQVIQLGEQTCQNGESKLLSDSNFGKGLAALFDWRKQNNPDVADQTMVDDFLRLKGNQAGMNIEPFARAATARSSLTSIISTSCNIQLNPAQQAMFDAFIGSCPNSTFLPFAPGLPATATAASLKGDVNLETDKQATRFAKPVRSALVRYYRRNTPEAYNPAEITFSSDEIENFGPGDNYFKVDVGPFPDEDERCFQITGFTDSDVEYSSGHTCVVPKVGVNGITGINRDPQTDERVNYRRINGPSPLAGGSGGNLLFKTDKPWSYDIADWNNDGIDDWVGFRHQGDTGTGIRSTEIHVLNGAKPEWLYQSATAMPWSDFKNYSFHMADWNGNGSQDMILIKQGGASSTEVHVIDTNNPMAFSSHNVTALPRTKGELWHFDIADWNNDSRLDVVGVKQRGASSTELHVLDGNNLNRFLLQTATALPRTDVNWDFEVADWNGNGTQDLVGLNRNGSSSTELRVVDGGQPSKLLASSATSIPRTNTYWSFLVSK